MCSLVGKEQNEAIEKTVDAELGPYEITKHVIVASYWCLMLTEMLHWLE